MSTIAESIRTISELMFAGIATLVLASTVAAQTVVVGTGDPNIDIPAVQDAVDHGGHVFLKGRFSFDRPPMRPSAFPGYLVTILVSNAVVISGTSDDEGGTSDEHGGMTSIAAGTVPFYVEAPGARVELLGLRFIHPKAEAIAVSAVSGLVIASCKIEGVEPLNGGSDGIGIVTTGPLSPPNPNTNPGKPENISGTLLIANNEIDVPGTSLDSTVGINIFSVGVPGAEVNAYVSRNTVTNSTERAIDVVRVGGRASIVRNTITTSTTLGPGHVAFGRGTDVINVRGNVPGTGSYLVAGNSVQSRWAAASGIRVQGFNAVWPLIGAVVIDNEVDMEAPEGTVFDDNSTGIDVRGYANRNVVANNRVRGHANFALSVSATQGSGTAVSANNDFLLNRVDDFEASLADILVDTGVMNTRIEGCGTVDDQGTGTVIVPLPRLCTIR
jgi:hypothetical protein